jgi:hypothetical protein
MVIKLDLRLFKLQPLVFGRRLTPQVNLVGCGGHVKNCSLKLRLLLRLQYPPFGMGQLAEGIIENLARKLRNEL